MCMQNTAMARRWHDLTGHIVNPPSAHSERGRAEKRKCSSGICNALQTRPPREGPHCWNGTTAGKQAAVIRRPWGSLIRAQEKECPRASLCGRATRTALSFLCHLFRLRITPKQASVWIHLRDSAADRRKHQGHRLRQPSWTVFVHGKMLEGNYERVFQSKNVNIVTRWR